MKVKSMHKRMTKIEMLRPELRKLAGDVGGTIYGRAGEWWLSPWDKQLTYARDLRGGKTRILNMEGKADLAKELLLRILDARKQPAWGTEMERAERILAGLREETIPNLLRGHYCYFRHESMDSGCIFWPRIFGSRRPLWIQLIGKPEVKSQWNLGEIGNEERDLDQAFSEIRTLLRAICSETLPTNADLAR